MSHKNFVVIDTQVIEAMCARYRIGASVSDLMNEFNYGRNKIVRTLKGALKEEYVECAARARFAVGQKVAPKLRGRSNPHTPEWNAKIAAAHVGLGHNDKTKALLSRRGKERELDPEWQARKPEIARKIIESKRMSGYFELHAKRHSEWMREHSPMRGKRISDDTRARMRVCKKELIAQGWRPTQVEWTDERREKVRQHTKKSWHDGKFTYGSENGIMRSKLEIRTYELIKIHYPDAEHTWPIHTERRSYHYDVFVPSLNTLVEINGDFWHCNPKLRSEDEWAKIRNVRRVWKADEEKAQVAIEHGYRFVTLWENDLNESEDPCNHFNSYL
jgi:hypothetical protein